MMINILSLGRFKLNQNYRQIFEYYRKRIRIKTNIIEIKTYNNQIHIINAPSPAATSALSIADHIIDNYIE